MIGLLAIGFLSFTTACGNGNETDDLGDADDMQEVTQDTEVNNGVMDDIENEQSPVQDNADDMDSKMETLGYHDISVEVEYSDNQEFQFSIEQDRNEPIEVEFENELTNEYLQGQEAFAKLYPVLETLEIKSDSSESNIIDKILSGFDLSNDYLKIEVEIEFNDGTKIDFEHRNE